MISYYRANPSSNKRYSTYESKERRSIRGQNTCKNMTDTESRKRRNAMRVTESEFPRKHIAAPYWTLDV